MLTGIPFSSHHNLEVISSEVKFTRPAQGADENVLHIASFMSETGMRLTEPLFIRTDAPGFLTQTDFDHYVAQYARTGFQGALAPYRCMRFPELPRLTEKQIAVLDLVDALCEEPDMCLDMAFGRGDMPFISNDTMLHSRSAYEDSPDPAQRRYLLRLWLETGLVDQIPASWAERYADTHAWARDPKPPSFDISVRRMALAH